MDRKTGTINPKTTTLYKGSYCKQLIEMGKKGKSVSEFCSKIGVCEDTFYAWARKYTEFMQAKSEYKTHAKAWWLAYGQEHITTFIEEKGTGVRFDTALYKLQVGGRFGFGHTQEKDPSVDDFSEGTMKERYEAVMKSVMKGNITTEQALSYVDLIKSGISIDNHTELLNVVEQLMKQVDHLKSMTLIPKVADEPEYEEVKEATEATEATEVTEVTEATEATDDN